MWDEIERDVVWITTQWMNAVLAVAVGPQLSKVNKELGPHARPPARPSAAFRGPFSAPSGWIPSAIDDLTDADAQPGRLHYSLVSL